MSDFDIQDILDRVIPFSQGGWWYMCQALEKADIKGVVSAKEAQFARKEIAIYLAELKGKPFEKDTPLEEMYHTLTFRSLSCSLSKIGLPSDGKARTAIYSCWRYRPRRIN